MFYVIVCNIAKTHFMKNILFIFVCLSLFACKKTNISAPSYSTTQIWDSVGIQYEKKYWATSSSIEIPDTFILHANNSITEILSDTSVTFNIIIKPIYENYNLNNVFKWTSFSLDCYSLINKPYGESHSLLNSNLYHAFTSNDSMAMTRLNDSTWSFGSDNYTTN